MGTHFPLGSARLWRPSAGAGEGMSALVCALSGEVPSEPVVSIKSGHLFEKKLITKYVEVLYPLLLRYDGSHSACAGATALLSGPEHVWPARRPPPSAPVVFSQRTFAARAHSAAGARGRSPRGSGRSACVRACVQVRCEGDRARKPLR